MKPEKWLIAIPSRGTVDLRVLSSFRSAASRLLQNAGIPSQLEFIVGFDVTTARNEAVKKLKTVHTDCTHILFLDDDIRLDPSSLISLYETKNKMKTRVTSGVTPLVLDDEVKVNVMNDDTFMTHWPTQDFYSKAVGASCLLVESSVFDEVTFPWFTFVLSEKTNSGLGEDISFCSVLNTLSISISISAKCRVGHYKSMDISKIVPEVEPDRKVKIWGWPSEHMDILGPLYQEYLPDLGINECGRSGTFCWHAGTTVASRPDGGRTGATKAKYDASVFIVQEPVRAIREMADFLASESDAVENFKDWAELYLGVAWSIQPLRTATDLYIRWMTYGISQTPDAILRMETATSESILESLTMAGMEPVNSHLSFGGFDDSGVEIDLTWDKLRSNLPIETFLLLERVAGQLGYEYGEENDDAS